MSLRQAMRLLRADLLRRLLLEGRAPNLLNVLSLLLHRGIVAVIWYRLGAWALGRGWRRGARLCEMIGTYATKSELHAGAVIGPGLVVSDLGGIGIPDFAIIGSNCTFLGPALLTLGGMENIDLAHDRIRLGSGCIIGQGARLLGPIELGDGAQIKPNAVVITSFAKPGQIIAGIPARRRGTVPPDLVLNWNPLRGRPLGTVS